MIVFRLETRPVRGASFVGQVNHRGVAFMAVRIGDHLLELGGSTSRRLIIRRTFMAAVCAAFYTAGQSEARADGPRGGPAGDHCGPMVLALLGDPCFEIGDQVEVAVAMSNAGQPIIAGQFFLAYSTTVLDFVSISPGDYPFIFQIGKFVDEEEGLIDYAVGVAPGDGGTMTDAIMAWITFEVISDQDIPYVVWRNEQSALAPSCDTDFVDAGQEDDVDVTDFAGFQRCFMGDAAPVSDCCQLWFDDDADGDVDSLDYAVFHASFTGPTLWVCDG